jgi:hypothetical protein
MNDIHDTIERIQSANPVPTPDALPTGALSSTALLTRIDERSTAMTDTLTPIRGTGPGKRPGRGRGPLVALAVAAVLILIIGLASFAFLNGDENAPVVDDNPAPTTTQAPTTTVASLPQSPLPADTPPLEVVAAVQAAWAAGDMPAAEALIRPDSGFFEQNSSTGFAAELWYRNATGVVVTDQECTVETPPELANEGFEGTFVTCTESLTSGITPGSVIGGGTLAVTVQDGWVVDVFILGYQGALDGERNGYVSYQNAYLRWMQDRFPDESEGLFDGIDMVIDTPAARARHQELVPFFLADTGPRGELALPAGTSLLDTVAEFRARWDAGDVAGYEAIFHPLSGYQSGQDAPASWFVAVTGTTANVDCTLVEPTQLRCTEVVTPGLAPDTTLEPFTTVWNGAAGYIWSIDFPDGPPPGFSDPLTSPGVSEYRAWVKENRPDDVDLLFIAGLEMRLDTQEARDAHREMVATYLAATAGG